MNKQLLKKLKVLTNATIRAVPEQYALLMEGKAEQITVNVAVRRDIDKRRSRTDKNNALKNQLKDLF